MHIKMPKLPRVSAKNDTRKFALSAVILARHGFGVQTFARTGVGFFKIVNQQEDLSVPISDYYFLSHKEFSLFVDILQRLDAAELKVDELKTIG
jgi:hypothetical protein